jgi:hypothetical protein
VIRWFSLLPFSIGFTLLAYALAPVWVRYAKPLNGRCNNDEYEAVEPRLSGWMLYLSTMDNSLLGDDGHKARWAGKDQRDQMIDWIRRNPAYTFDWWFLAANITADMKPIVKGNPNIKNRDNARAGSYFCRVGKYWNYKLIKHLFGDTALMLEFGWKLQGFAQGRETEGKAMYVFSIRLTAFKP